VTRLVDKSSPGNITHSFPVTCIASYVDELNEVNYIVTGGEDNAVKVTYT